MKKMFVMTAAILLTLVFAGCSSSSQQSASVSDSQSSSGVSEVASAEPLNLEGEWKQANKPLAFGPHKAVIDGDTIMIYWIDEDSDSESLYWAGTYSAPTEPGDTWEWVSENNHELTDKSMYAASADTKVFEYENGQILYKASALGTTQTVRLEQVE